MVEISITPSGTKHKVSDEYASKDSKALERKWKNIEDISREILIEDYRKRVAEIEGKVAN